MDFIDGSDVEKTLDAALAAQLLFASCFLLSSWWLVENYYAGIVAVVTALVFISFPCATWYLLRRNINRTYYGVVLGAYSVLTVISLQAAIFWGQYSHCDHGHLSESSSGGSEQGSHGGGDGPARRLAAVDCENVGAMKALCTFSAILFTSHVAFGFVLFQFKDRILGTERLDEGIPSMGRTVNPFQRQGGSSVVSSREL